MALFKFTKSIIENNPIDVFNNGDMIRDFTYIDDICESITRVIYKNATLMKDSIKKIQTQIQVGHLTEYLTSGTPAQLPNGIHKCNRRSDWGKSKN